MEKFYTENYHIVYGFLLSLCADPSLAEELAAETFLRAIEHINRYDPRYKPSTWLCTIARNLFYNECKRKKRFVSLNEADWIATPSAEALHMQKDEARRFFEILDTFTAEHKQLVIMRLEGMSFRDIGLSLGKNENWARVTFYRLKLKLRSGMEGEI